VKKTTLIVVASPKLTPQDRKRLTAEMRAGSKEAKTILMDSVLPWVNRLISRFHAKYPWIEFDDIASELYYRAVLSLETFEPDKGALTTYITQSAFFAMRSLLKRSARNKTVPLDDATAAAIEDRPLQPPSNYAVELAFVNRDLRGMNQRDRDIYYRKMAGQKHTEIAKAMGISKQRVHQITKAITLYISRHWKKTRQRR